MGVRGTIYRNGSRYWWKVRLPGEDKPKPRPLKPVGAKFATKDLAVAKAIAREFYNHAITRSETGDRTLCAVVAMYRKHIQGYYRNSREAENIGYAIDFLAGNTDRMLAADYRPLMLKALRDKMITQGWSRSTINKRLGMIKRMFKWAAAEELVPLHVAQGVALVENLQAGRSDAKETEPVLPVPEAHIYAVKPYTSKVVGDMMELQLLTGMRSTELCSIRPLDVETSGEIWLYRPRSDKPAHLQHKTAHHGHTRIIAIGKRGQTILKPYLLKRRIDAYCFSPEEANEQNFVRWQANRKTPPTHGNSRGSNCKGARTYSDRYDKNTYRRAVKHAIAACNKDNDKQIPMFHPHRIRHTAATRIRKKLGLDAARAVLGHAKMEMTLQYAEIDRSLATKVARMMG